MIIVNDNGREFYVRVVLKGEKYGRDDCVTHTEVDPLVEFYDFTYAGPNFKFGPRGQFVSRYYASTLATHRPGTGLYLDGGIPEWSLDASALREVLKLVKQLHEAITRQGAP